MLKNEINIPFESASSCSTTSGMVSPIVHLKSDSSSGLAKSTSGSTIVHVSSVTSMPGEGGLVAETSSEQKIVLKDGEVVEKTTNER